MAELAFVKLNVSKFCWVVKLRMSNGCLQFWSVGRIRYCLVVGISNGESTRHWVKSKIQFWVSQCGITMIPKIIFSMSLEIDTPIRLNGEKR